MMFRVSLTSWLSKSREMTRANANDTAPRTISNGRLIDPNTKMNEKVIAAPRMLMMNDRMTK